MDYLGAVFRVIPTTPRLVEGHVITSNTCPTIDTGKSVFLSLLLSHTPWRRESNARNWKQFASNLSFKNNAFFLVFPSKLYAIILSLQLA